MYGGSTGGWEALAAQVLYPDEYNGCWAACPDPIDFRQYTVVNIYEDENAYFWKGPFARVDTPAHRNYLGHLQATVEQTNRLELVLGTKGRSGGQWDIWQAVYSPVGADGYPKPIWDKRTGVIDKEVAAYWKENYDLVRDHESRLDQGARTEARRQDPHLRRRSRQLLPEQRGLSRRGLPPGTTEPDYAGEIDYGPRAEHCWNGDHTQPNAISRLRYHQMFAPKIVERIEKSAPPGADLKSWRY